LTAAGGTNRLVVRGDMEKLLDLIREHASQYAADLYDILSDSRSFIANKEAEESKSVVEPLRHFFYSLAIMVALLAGLYRLETIDIWRIGLPSWG
jgi:hypothetical protein